MIPIQNLVIYHITVLSLITIKHLFANKNIGLPLHKTTHITDILYLFKVSVCSALNSKNLFTTKHLFVNNKTAVYRSSVVMSLFSCHSDSNNYLHNI